MREMWEVNGNSRLISDGIASYQIDITRPEFGMTVACGGMKGTLFSLPTLQSSTTDLVDEFVRQEKLFTRYHRRVNPALEISVMYQFGNSWLDELNGDQFKRVSAIELTLSIQTPLLDADPIDQIGFRLSFEKAPQIDFFSTINTNVPLVEPNPPKNVVIANASGFATMLMVHSSDCSGLELNPSHNSMELIAKLNSQNLEKGVIRRHRLVFAIAAADQSATSNSEVLQSVANAFENAELPLST